LGLELIPSLRRWPGHTSGSRQPLMFIRPSQLHSNSALYCSATHMWTTCLQSC